MLLTNSGLYPLPGGAIEDVGPLSFLFFRLHQKAAAPSASKAITGPATAPAIHALDEEVAGSPIAVGVDVAAVLDALDVVTEDAGVAVGVFELVEVVDVGSSWYMVWATHPAFTQKS